MNDRQPSVPNEFANHFLLQLSIPTQIRNIFTSSQTTLSILRDDRLATGIGTKSRKFLGIHSELERRGIDNVILQGELHSNALAAFAFLFHRFGYQVRSIAYARDKSRTTPNAVLVRENSHSLTTYSSRFDWKRAVQEADALSFRNSNIIQNSNIQEFEFKNDETWGIVPEFGFCHAAAFGLDSLWKQIPIEKYDRLVLDLGSGLTWLSALNFFQNRILISGISIGLSKKKMIPWLNDEKSILGLETLQIDPDCIYEPEDDSGFGSLNPEILEYCKTFEKKHTIPIEPIYSGRTLKTIEALIADGSWNGRILYIHQGGLLNFRI
ncbi:1-aminocyclopropane-1-carboxylate deaminase [Leptospira barantonii]|uniref:1-aminocyclopropane-1-carboxylate deaminase n=1 Tax=Leptospira barantonii TaxID=2023184 RepID=A0ABX4NIX0_9LEPT|nr:1-aminocyclopropane-1-carboxylate deaminase [Leptospira barantonii]PJZ56758.1 1-aminocyclopropane-1-carboxylate deaminase [Leptospira barantonii]